MSQTYSKRANVDFSCSIQAASRGTGSEVTETSTSEAKYLLSVNHDAYDLGSVTDRSCSTIKRCTIPIVNDGRYAEQFRSSLCKQQNGVQKVS